MLFVFTSNSILVGGFGWRYLQLEKWWVPLVIAYRISKFSQYCSLYHIWSKVFFFIIFIFISSPRWYVIFVYYLTNVFLYIFLTGNGYSLCINWNMMLISLFMYSCMKCELLLVTVVILSTALEVVAWSWNSNDKWDDAMGKQSVTSSWTSKRTFDCA